MSNYLIKSETIFKVSVATPAKTIIGCATRRPSIRIINEVITSVIISVLNLLNLSIASLILDNLSVDCRGTLPSVHISLSPGIDSGKILLEKLGLFSILTKPL